MNNNTKPLQVFRDRHEASVAASIWLRQTRAGVFYDVTFARLWVAETGETRYTQSFSDRHLDALIRVASDARDFIAEKKSHAETVTIAA